MDLNDQVNYHDKIKEHVMKKTQGAHVDKVIDSSLSKDKQEVHEEI